MLNASAFLTKNLISLSDVLWSHVMNVQAAARANDIETFNHILADMIKLTEESTVNTALLHIPESDWRAWAIGIVRLAAATIRDDSLCHELDAFHQESIQSARKANSTANAMMAYLCEVDASLALSKQSSGYIFKTMLGF